MFLMRMAKMPAGQIPKELQSLPYLLILGARSLARGPLHGVPFHCNRSSPQRFPCFRWWDGGWMGNEKRRRTQGEGSKHAAHSSPSSNISKPKNKGAWSAVPSPSSIASPKALSSKVLTMKVRPPT